MDDSEDLTIEQLWQGIVNCNQCNEKHVIYECPQLPNMNAEQQRAHFRQLSETRRAQRSSAVRQVNTYEESQYNDAHAYNNMTGKDWLEFQRNGPDFYRGEYY